MATIVHSPHFAMGFPGLRYLHPFDSYRPRRVYRELMREFALPSVDFSGEKRGVRFLQPQGPVTDTELLQVHTPEYLASLKKSWTVAVAIEVLPFALTPRAFLDWCLVTPMRWAVNGTVLACREALEHGLAFSLSGGFHHAKPDRGEGFCLFSDIGLAVHLLRSEGKLNGDVVYVDLDAHQGNGVCHVFRDDPSVKLFDVYNGDIYPQEEEETRQRLDVSIPLEMGAEDAVYEEALSRLPEFLEQHTSAGLVIYNAGSDVVSGDRLGGLEISPEMILRRDLLVLGECRRLGLPVVFLPSGGYTAASFQLITRSLVGAIQALG